MRYHIMYSSKGDNRSVYIASSYRNENGQSRIFYLIVVK